MAVLAPLFALTALLYASVGFGGGSTYNALLILAKTDYAVLPAIALICNIIVVAGGSWRFAREAMVPWRRLWPILLLSAPCAWLGGLTPIGARAFTITLGCSLVIAALAMVVRARNAEPERVAPFWRWMTPVVGAGAGYLAGLVGIGGGIFLAPVLHLAQWDAARRIAATASVFILVNSIAGLIGQATKLGATGIAQVAAYWPLMLGVLVGGQLGSMLGARIIPPAGLRIVTALLILYVAIQLLWRAFI